MKIEFIIAGLAFLAMPITAAHAELPASVGYVESENAPIRVYYDTAEHATLADGVMAYAEEAWAAIVTDLGFPEPHTVDDTLAPVHGMRIYLTPSTDYAGCALAIAPIPETTATDCADIILLGGGLTDWPDWYVREIVFHEAIQTALESIDCAEGLFAIKQTAVALTAILSSSYTTLVYMLPGFQNEPYRPFYYLNPAASSYHYGASLFSLFLEDRYGAGDGSLSKRFWEQVAQPGTVEIGEGGQITATVENEPDLLDSMRTVLTEEGVSLEDALAAFTVQRYFVGSFDDDNHMVGTSAWEGCEPHLDKRYFADELPVADARPEDNPQELGASYIAFDFTGSADKAFRLAFAGSSAVDWSVAVLVIKEGPAREVTLALDASQEGTTILTGLDGASRVVLAVTNLGDGEGDPDDPYVEGEPFTYSAALLDCAPVVLSAASPASVEPGGPATVTLSGSGFAADQRIDASVSGEEVEVSRVVRGSATTLDLELEVGAGAPEGRRDVTVTLECGATGTAAGLLRVTTSGCGCAGTTAGQAAALAALLAVLFLRCRARTMRRAL